MLDFHTLQVASIISRLAFVFVFIVTLSRHPSEIYFGIWAAALCSSLTATFMMLGDAPTVPLLPLKGAAVYLLYGGSLSASWLGLRIFYGRTAPVLQVFVLALCPGLFYGLGLHFGVSIEWGFTAVFGWIGLSAGLCIFEIVRAPAQERLWTQYIVLSGFLGYLIAFVATIVVIHFANDQLATPENGVYSLLFDQWCGVFIQVGYLAMVGERAHLKLSHLAETDPLTGLANRRGLFAALKRRAGGENAAWGRAVFLIDIDRFKAINDTYGHDGGDAVLVGFAERMRSVMRKDDLIARWGGEEVLVVLNCADGAQATAVAERLRAAVAAQPFMFAGTAIAVTSSIGVSVRAGDETRIDGAIARADAALYAAKNGGRNQVRLELPAPSAKAESPWSVPSIEFSPPLANAATAGPA